MSYNPQKILEEALACHKTRQFGQASKLYSKVLKVDKKNFKVIYLMAESLFFQGKAKDATPHLLKAIKIKPDFIDAHILLSEIYRQSRAYKQCLAIVDKGLALDSKNVKLLTQKALCLCDSGLAAEGIPYAEQATALAPNNVAVIRIDARCKFMAGHYKDAIQVSSVIMKIDPNDSACANSIGASYAYLGDSKKAIEWYQLAIKLNPKLIEAYNNMASIFAEDRRYDEAIELYDKALAIKPDYFDARSNKAMILRRLGLFEDALAILEGLLKEDVSRPEVYSNYLMAIHYIDDFPQEKIFEAQKEYDRKYCKPLAPKKQPEFGNDLNADRCLRVGMLSNNFMKHPVGYMILPMLEHMNKERVKFFVYSKLKEQKKDEFTDRIKGHVEEWHEILGKSDLHAMELIKNDKIDILLELTGHAEGGSCLSIVARRAAPVQVKWIGGLFDTSGMTEMDWIIGDAIEIPEGDEKWYTEKVYRMPDDYICYEPPEYAGDVQPLPALENGYITFGNLNNPSKINKASLDLWAEIMLAVPDSKMIFSSRAFKYDKMYNRVMDAFKAHGVEEDRIIIEFGAPHEEFIKLYNRIDIAIDPYPYSGGLTTCEALWLGVPVIALPGPTFAGKHAATHLHNAGYPEWIMQDRVQAINWAKKWANDLDGLAALRAEMRDKVSVSPLVDGKRFAENFEQAMRDMWNQYIDEQKKI